MIELPIYYAFARSGGTLLNRCLGCISENLVLSEVNPHHCIVPVEQQARDWFELIDEKDHSVLQPRSYPEKILATWERAIDRGKHLIIRDWCFVNFLGAPVLPLEQFQPSGVLEQPLYLEPFGLRLRPIVFARRAASVYHSKVFADLALDVFAAAYLAFARAVCGLPIFHYEDFCANPPVQLERMCQALGVGYNPAFLNDFARFNHCTGDNVINGGNPTAPVNMDRIAQTSPPRSDPRYVAASQDSFCQEADRLLGYANEL